MIYVYLVLALLITSLGAYTDICFGRVKNKHMIIALATWIAFIAWDSIANHSLSISPIPFIINIVLAFVVSLIFYLTEIWAPGDCKLYIVIAIIFPLRAYVVREGNIFPALDIVIYAFALGYIALLGTIIYQWARNNNNGFQRALKPRINLSHILSLISSIGVITAVSSVLDIYVSDFYYANQMLCTLTIIGLLCLLQQKADIIKRLVGFAGLGCFLAQTIIYSTWQSAALGLVKSLVIAVIIEIINDRAMTNTYREITGDEVKPGMILAYSTVLAMQNCIDPELPRITTENRRSRMNQRQAEAVRIWCKNAKSNVVIVQMIPFAPFLALAVLVQTVRFLIIGN